MKLAIDDKLLIKQTSTLPASPWGYNIVHLPTSTTVVAQSNILTVDYVLLDITDTIFLTYVGEMLLLEIIDNLGDAIEDDLLLLSGPYNKFENLKLLIGLLGENVKHLATEETDFQDGYERAKVITTYTDNTLVTEIESYNWTQTFQSNFTPDHRFQRDKILQKKN